jgi:DNA-binding LacI/PurR family transcriptional regulator
VIPDINNPFFTVVVGGIESVLHRAGYSLLLTNSNEDPRRERDNVKMLQAENVAGIAFTPSAADASVYRKLAGRGVALVAIARVPGFPVDSVTVDSSEGAAKAVSHLIRLGHRRIALINGPEWSSSVQERETGYERAFEAAGLPVPSGLTVHSDLRQRGGHDAMAELLGRRHPPSAVFVGNNLMTLGALTAIHERGMRIPDDIAVIGFDDLPWAAALQPPLTAVALPTEAVGAAAAQLLLDRLADPGRPVRRVTLATKLVLRASCGAPARPMSS